MKNVLAAVAVACALAGCKPLADLDNRVAETSSSLAARCGELKTAVLLVDVFAPESVRAAARKGEVALNRFCAKPPTTVAELTIAVGEIIQAQQALAAAKKGA